MEKSFLKKCIDYEVDRYCGIFSNASGHISYFQKIWRRYFFPETNAVFLIRKFQFHISNHGRLHNLLARYYSVTLMRRYAIRIGDLAQIGLGLHTAHPYGIIMNNVTIGENLFVNHNTTIGIKDLNISQIDPADCPHIGNNVQLFAGCFVIGKIHVDDNVILGANACLMKDTEGPGVYVGTPAYKVK